jgi:DNA repair exonuclease SbcCD ATPase subunit
MVTKIIKPQLKEARQKLNEELAERKLLKTRLKEEQNRSEELNRKNKSLEKVRSVFQEAGTRTQQRIENHISQIVSTALASIWDDPYEFELEFVIKRGKTEANLWFVRNDAKFPPMDTAGGGAIDVASMALRIAAWSINKNTRPIIILDEPFKNLSENLQDRAASMLRMLSEKLDLQIIMVSHINNLVKNSDKIIEVKRGHLESYINERE